jgi:hypothetical protein
MFAKEKNPFVATHLLRKINKFNTKRDGLFLIENLKTENFRILTYKFNYMGKMHFSFM